VLARHPGVSPADPLFRRVQDDPSPTGEVCWLNELGRGYFDEAAGLTRMVGTVQDITRARKSRGASPQRSSGFRGSSRHAGTP